MSIDLDLSKYSLGWSDAEDYVFKPKRGLNEDIIRAVAATTSVDLEVTYSVYSPVCLAQEPSRQPLLLSRALSSSI